MGMAADYAAAAAGRRDGPQFIWVPAAPAAGEGAAVAREARYGGRVSYSVREAVAGEEETVLPLYEWLFAEPGTRPDGWDREWAAEALRLAIEGPQSAVFVARERGEPGFLGFATAYIDLPSVRYGTRCWVEDLAVDPDRRSAGIGGLLLDAAERWAGGMGATHLELDTGVARVEARRFYESRSPAAQCVSYQWSLDPRGS